MQPTTSPPPPPAPAPRKRPLWLKLLLGLVGFFAALAVCACLVLGYALVVA